MNPFTLLAPAKINLHLRVTGLRDDGRHTLDTSFAYVDLHDDLKVQLAPDLHVRCSYSHLEEQNNLVFQVLDAMRQRYTPANGLDVHVEKRIPEQAGLGGGSSDAATAMLAANHLWRLDLPISELIELATPYGADIPCFLYGQASLAAGIGDRLRPLPGPLPHQHIVLAHPGTGLSTAAVFHRFDEVAGHQLTHTIRADTMPARPDRWKGMPFPVGDNMLEPIACELCPGLVPLLAAMRRHVHRAWMSGSGTACVALLDDEGQAGKLAASLQQAGLAKWAYAGRLLATHPLKDVAHWGVAKW